MMSDERRVRETGGDVPPIVETSAGLYCMIHGRVDCTEPWCYACGNHLMDEWGRCADPKCRATNTSDVQEIIARLREKWEPEPVPVELISFSVATTLASPPGASPDAAPSAGPPRVMREP